MFFKDFKVAAARNFFFLQVLGMLLINFVATFFWQQWVVTNVLESAQSSIQSFTEEIEAVCENDPLVNDKVRGFRATTPPYTEAFLLHGKRSISENDVIPDDMRKLLQQSSSTGKVVHEQRGSFFSMYTFQNRYISMASPIAGCDSLQAAGISLDIKKLFSGIADKQSFIFIYIVLNAILLTAIWFFRMRRTVYEPLDSLIHMTESHKSYVPELFQVSSGKNEFGQLASAINHMFSRIESDREKLSETVKSLEEANRHRVENQKNFVEAEKFAAVGRLSAGLAHEVGNPLGIIRGYLELLADHDLAVDDRTQFAKRSLKELDRMIELIEQLLNFAQKKKGKQTSADIPSVIGEVVGLVEHQKDSRGVSFIVRGDKEGAPLYAQCGEADIHQVLLNCILNSIDAIKEKGTEHGGVKIRSRRLTRDNAGFCEITIEDNGTGIEEKDLHSVFEPFFTTKEVGRGTGLGLSVSRSIVESYEGSISVKNSSDGGTVVTITLPLATNYSSPN